MGWLIALGILVLLAITPVGVLAGYNADGILLRIVAGPVKITILPSRKKEKKPKEKAPKPKKEKPAKPKNAAPAAKKEEKGGSVLDFLPLLQIVFDFLGEFRRKLRVDRLELKLILAGGDPATLGINYGKAWAAVGNLMPQLERVFVIRKRNIEVECDFTADKTRVLAHLDLTITLGRILWLTFALIGRAGVALIKIVMKRKGCAVNEPESS